MLLMVRFSFLLICLSLAMVSFGSVIVSRLYVMLCFLFMYTYLVLMCI